MAERSVSAMQFGSVMVTIQRFSSGMLNIRLADSEGKGGGWTMPTSDEQREFLAELCRATLAQAHGKFEF